MKGEKTVMLMEEAPSRDGQMETEKEKESKEEGCIEEVLVRLGSPDQLAQIGGKGQ